MQSFVVTSGRLTPRLRGATERSVPLDAVVGQQEDIMADKRQHCFYCGDDLGIYDAPYRELQTCGKQVCNAEARAQERCETENAFLDAAQDNYERYR